MTVTVRISKSFKTAVKPLLKKYPSLSKELNQLELDLQDNPKLGVPLGYNAYKIRIEISSKGKGKSGGARVISILKTTLLSEIQTGDLETTVNLITIYDKGETATINDAELRELIKSFYKNR